MAVDQAVEARRGRIGLGARRAHDGIRCQIDARTLHLAQVELSDAARVHQRNFNVKTAVVIAQGFDRFSRHKGAVAQTRQQARAGIAVALCATHPPVSGLGHERNFLIAARIWLRFEPGV